MTISDMQQKQENTVSADNNYLLFLRDIQERNLWLEDVVEEQSKLFNNSRDVNEDQKSDKKAFYKKCSNFSWFKRKNSE